MPDTDPRQVYERIARQDMTVGFGGLMIFGAYSMFIGQIVEPSWPLYVVPAFIWLVAAAVTHRRRTSYTCPACGRPFYGRKKSDDEGRTPCPVCGTGPFWVHGAPKDPGSNQ